MFTVKQEDQDYFLNETSINKTPERQPTGEVVGIYKCPFCLERFSQTEIFKNHLFTHEWKIPEDDVQLENKQVHRNKKVYAKKTRNGIFKCPKCKYSSADSATVKRHLANTHDETKPFKCDKCDYFYDSISFLRRHQTIVHNETINGKYPCKICGKLLKRGDLGRHYSTVHDPTRPYRCSKCTLAFNNVGQLNRHKTLVHNKDLTINGKYPCRFCGKLFNRYHLAIHVRYRHTKEKPFQCQQCEYKATEENQLKKHVKTIHFGVDINLKNQSLINKKTNRNSDKILIKTELNPKSRDICKKVGDRYKCTQCPYKHIYPSNIKDHYFKLHNEERQFKCSKCRCAFQNAGQLHRHETVVHNRTLTINGKYPCTICGKLLNRYQLKIHMMCHTGVRPYECKLCKHKSTVLAKIKSHLQTVHREKPATSFTVKKEKLSEDLSIGIVNEIDYSDLDSQNKTGKRKRLAKNKKKNRTYPCKYCGTTFVNVANLKRHENSVHSQTARPFKCQYCSASFLAQSTLSMHLKRVHQRKLQIKLEILRPTHIKQDMKIH